MEDMERQKFERELKKAFDQAEVSPSENLWTNIELDLIKAEGEKMKRRLVFYKLMAAASITFALCVVGLGAYYVQHQNSFATTNEIALNSKNGNTVVTELKPVTPLEDQLYNSNNKQVNESTVGAQGGTNQSHVDEPRSSTSAQNELYASASSDTRNESFNVKESANVAKNQAIISAIRKSNLKRSNSVNGTDANQPTADENNELVE